MPELRGTISEKELEAYGGINIMLLDNQRNTPGSGVTLQGSGDYTWSISYDENGFSGSGSWYVMPGLDLGIKFNDYFPDIDIYIRDNAVQTAQRVFNNNYTAADEYGCATFEEVATTG